MVVVLVLGFMLNHGAAMAAQEQPGDSSTARSSAPFTAPESIAMQSQTPAGFSLADVKAKALEMAAKPFENPDGKVPDFLLNISYDQWRKIRFQADHALWREQNLPFEVQFFHPGLFYNRLVDINIVENGQAVPIKLGPDLFSYGDPALRDKVAALNLGFAGFRLHFPLNRPDYKDEVVVFLGASYFRALAQNTQYGLSARALAVDTALQSGEEFPYFREFWLVKPAPGDTEITVYGLMDSPSLVGAYRFVVRPGVTTAMDVDCNLYLRKDVAKLGLAPLTSMFLFGETENGMSGDYRPEVHDSDGLLSLDNEGVWTWAPLANPKRLAVISTPMNDPRGFGLLQRDADFDHYQDLEARYERRPSLWVEPRGNWGKGFLEMIEIPSVEEIHDNMVAFWVPDKANFLPEGAAPDTKLRYAPQMNWQYTVKWMLPGINPHNLAAAVSTRMAKGQSEDTRRFVVDFAGGALKNLPPDAGLTSVLTLPEGVRLVDKQLMYNPETRGWRLVFQVALPQEGVLQNLISRGGSQNFRFSALLKQGENVSEPLTETWAYDLQL